MALPTYGTVDGDEDLYPKDSSEHAKLLNWCRQARQAAEAARQPFEEVWMKSFKLYRCYVRRKEGDWRSKVFMPEVFQTIESILPRMVSQLPKFLVNPRGAEDVDGAEIMELLLEWATKNSKLYLELVKVYKSALLYGTGILKTYPNMPGCPGYWGYGYKAEPQYLTVKNTIDQPVRDPDNPMELLRDMNGRVMTEPVTTTYEQPNGFKMVPERFVAYDGPVATQVDLLDFWVNPEAKDLDQAQYVIHRSYRPMEEVLDLVEQGIYVWPDDLDKEDLFDTSEQEAHLDRLDSIDLGAGKNDPLRKKLELREYHVYDGPNSPGRIITVANDRAILRVGRNPFTHGQKPFVRFVDYIQDEFWGMGEVEAIAPLQDLENAIVNQRVDNVRLAMDRGYIVNSSQLKDVKQLRRRPGQVIEVIGDGMVPRDIVEPLDLGDVTSSSFAEAQATQAMIERTTGVSGFQNGVESPTMNETATGAAIMSEAGASRFAMKTAINEIDALQRLAYHFGSLLQQFVPQERTLRVLGPDGAREFKALDPLSLQGSFDYDIETASIQQSETVKRDQALNLWREFAPFVAAGQPLPPTLLALAKDVMEAFGHKDPGRYLAPQGEMPPAQLVPGAPGDQPALPMSAGPMQ